MITDEALRPYGFRRGKVERWCASCERIHQGLSPDAFKCRSCAVDQFRLVEKQIETCDAGGQLPSNPVPPQFQCEAA